MKTVTAMFDNHRDVQPVLDQLNAAGFTNEYVGLALRGDTLELPDEEQPGHTAVETAVKGVEGGAALGGLIGLLAGAGALLVPGVGPLLAAGALASVLSATAAGAGIGAAYGAIVGALTGWDVAEEHAREYVALLREGGALVVVREANRDRADEAAEIMRAGGATVRLHD
jgi:hypothetical protein